MWFDPILRYVGKSTDCNHKQILENIVWIMDLGQLTTRNTFNLKERSISTVSDVSLQSRRSKNVKQKNNKQGN